MKLIDKDALIAEIKRRIKGLKDCHADTVPGYAGEISGLKRLLSFLDAIEVKEVDLEKEMDFVKDAYYYFTSDERDSMMKVARHFFELGLKVRKENKS